MTGTSSTTQAGNSPKTPNSGSSASPATVVVTARDIEFSNYNRSTNKWGGAVMTMMIEDTSTPANVNLEVYDEKVYAVFRNHDDPTDLVEFSPEVDGMDFRVTTTDPMVPSAKYELYKVYGETSGDEYATSSEFYFQVPGRVWDFANDTVGQDDITLVSDWYDYGSFIDTNDARHGFSTRDEAVSALTKSTFTVDGVSYARNDIKKLKISSHTTGDVSTLSGQIIQGGKDFNSLQEMDIVASGATKLPDQFLAGYSCPLAKKFAFPSTLTETPYRCLAGERNFNAPVWIPDNVTSIGSNLLRMASIYNAKVHFPENDNGVSIGDEVIAAPPSMVYNQPIEWPSRVNSIGEGFLYYSTYNQDFVWPLTRNTTDMPNRSCNFWTNYTGAGAKGIDITISNGITSIGDNCFQYVNRIKSIIIPNTVTSIGNECFAYVNPISNFATNLTLAFPSSVTSVGRNFLYYVLGQTVTLTLPPNVITIGDNFMNSCRWTTITNWGWDSTNRSLTIPSTVTTIGNGFLSGLGTLSGSRLKKIVVPSSVTSIGTDFCGSLTGDSDQTIDQWETLEVDLSAVDPDVFQDNDTSSFRMYNGGGSIWYAYKIKVSIAPGTKELWEDKFPNIQDPNTGYYIRYIEWEEPTTQYGYVFYKENPSDTKEKYVELQSLAEFNSLVSTQQYNYAWSTTVGEDQITVCSGWKNVPANNYKDPDASNVITGVRIGTDITSIPDLFLYSCVYMEDKYNVIIPNTVTTLGRHGFSQLINLNAKVILEDGFVTSPTILDGNLFNDAGNELKTTNNNLQLIIGEGVEKISGFRHWYYCNNVIVFPSTLKEIASYALDGWTHYNQPLNLPSGLLRIGTAGDGYSAMADNGWQSFNQPVTFPAGLTILRAGWLNTIFSFNQDIIIPNTVTEVGNKATSLLSFINTHEDSINPFCSTIDFQNLRPTDLFNNYTITNFNIYKFASQDASSPAYTTGITIKGTYADEWIATFPNMDGEVHNGHTFYRKLIKYVEPPEESE